jgi:hypothetical protein
VIKDRHHRAQAERSGVAFVSSCLKKLLDYRGRQISDIKFLADEPSAQVRHQPEMIAHRAGGIALVGELLPKSCGVGR